MEYPLLVETYGLVEDSAGPGRQRGGMGLRRTIRPLDHACSFNGAIERAVHRPWGLFGGGEGGRGRLLHVTQSGEIRQLPSKPSAIPVKAGERITIETPGGGGYGHPSERAKEAIKLDRRSGKLSDAYLAHHYGLPPAAE
jgi:N-methylhydantoinase B